MSGIVVEYSEFNKNIKKDFYFDVGDKTSFSKVSDLQKSGLLFKNYSNPCETYSVVLDGNSLPLPSNTSNENTGVWSDTISNDDGSLLISYYFESDSLHSSSGISFVFDTYNNIFPTILSITWYRGETAIESEIFYPDSPKYFCSKKVENYSAFSVAITKLNMPKNRLKLREIDFGVKIVFTGDEIRSAKIIQEIDPLSTELAINVFDFVLDSKRDIDYNFQNKQPITVYFDGKLKEKTFINKFNRKSKNTWSIQSEDYIGVLDKIPFAGDVYKNKNIVDLFDEISELSNVSFDLSSDLMNYTVSGYIPYTTCREALQQIAFAVGCVIDTSDSVDVKVYFLDNNVKQTIPLRRIMTGQSFDYTDRASSVEVVAHEYFPLSSSELLYESEESGSNIFIKFHEPVYNITIENGTIHENGTNYAIIDASAGCKIFGYKFNHITTKKSKKYEDIAAGELGKVVSIQDATLVNPINIDTVLERCYNYYQVNQMVSLRIVDGKQEDESGNIIYDPPTSVGEKITTKTEYLGDVTGFITKQSFNLNGNILVKDTTLR